VRAADAAEVAAAGRFAAQWGLPVAVQATGHGTSLPADAGLQVIPRTRTARVEAGARWRQVMELELFPVARLYGGGLFYPGSAAPEVLHAYRRWTQTLPDELTSSLALLRLPPLPELPEPLRGRFVVHVRVAYHGDPATGTRLVEPLRAAAPPLMDTLAEMPFTMSDAVHLDPTTPGSYLDATTMLRDLDPAAVDTLLELAGPAADTRTLLVELRHLGGALARPPRSPTRSATGTPGSCCSPWTWRSQGGRPRSAGSSGGCWTGCARGPPAGPTWTSWAPTTLRPSGSGRRSGPATTGAWPP
jgi:hypothetical protein